MMMRRLAVYCCVKPLAAGARSFAGKGKGRAAVVEEVVDLLKVVPTNILKDGTHPELKDKSEYPEWLFTLLDPKPTLDELERAGFDNLEVEDQRRYLVLLNRRLIKTRNADKAKKRKQAISNSDEYVSDFARVIGLSFESLLQTFSLLDPCLAVNQVLTAVDKPSSTF